MLSATTQQSGTRCPAARNCHSKSLALVSSARCLGTRSRVIAGAADKRPHGLSLFVPYKSLPPDGQIVPKSEVECDVEVSNCKTPTYVYDDQCHVCSGTGWARGPSSRKRARGSLHTCLGCHGMGHVRRTTARFVPDTNGDDARFTLARTQRLPGELPGEPPAVQTTRSPFSALRKFLGGPGGDRQRTTHTGNNAAAPPGQDQSQQSNEKAKAPQAAPGSSTQANSNATSTGRSSSTSQEQAKEVKQQQAAAPAAQNNIVPAKGPALGSVSRVNKQQQEVVKK